MGLFASVAQRPGAVLTEPLHAVSPSANATVNNFLGRIYDARITHFENALVHFSEDRVENKA